MKLGVNIDHIATLRNARLPAGKKAYSAVFPDPVRAALICQSAGASAIVMHLREDRRHIRDADLFHVQKNLKIRLNMEMSIAPDIVRVACALKPDQATLVPEKRHEMTTEGGLDLLRHGRSVGKAVRRLHDNGIEVSLFVDPDPRQVDAACAMRADALEFHTGDYAHAFFSKKRTVEFARLDKAVRRSLESGLKAHAGHGLDYDNVPSLKKIPRIGELNIGYAIVTRALWVGLDRAVREMLAKMR